MGMDHQQTLKDNLKTLGYSSDQIKQVDSAGLNELSEALDFLQGQQSASFSTAALPTFQHTEHPTQLGAPTLSAGPQHTSALSNARNSLDHIDVARVPSESSIAANDVQNEKYSAPSNQQHDDELKRAIELSRKEQDERDIEKALRISKEEEISARSNDRDPDFMRAIEESLKDNQRFTGDRAVSWQSHAFNGENAIRESLENPVGLRNIGNTCYLNSLLQVYFHLPDFRRAIMAFRAPPDMDGYGSVNLSKATPPDAPNTVVPDIPAERKSETTSDWAMTPYAQESDVFMPSAYPESDSLPQPSSVEALPALSPSEALFSNAPATLKPENSDHRETSLSDKSDNCSEHRNKDQGSTRHAVEFVVELQRLFAAMALGNKACVDPTGVAHAMRDGDGNPIVIGDQQDASEFNHLFLEFVEKGLRGDEGITLTETKNTADTADNSTRFDACSETPDPVDKTGFSSESHNVNGDAASFATSRNISQDIVKDLFTVKFRQEVRKCEEDGSLSSENGDKTVHMEIEGETNCIIVDATSSKERDLYSGLDDYVVAKIEYEASARTNSDSDCGKASFSGKDATVAAITAIREEETGGKLPASTAINPAQANERVVWKKAEEASIVKSVKKPDTGTGAMERPDVEMNRGPSTWALKSVWLTKLPPVLVIYLQRVRYIREKAIAEKVHDRYDFAPEIALDRFLEKNRIAAGRARERVMRIRKERRRLTSLIQKYRSFPIASISDKDGVGTPGDDMEIESGEGELFSAGGRIRKRLLEAINPTSELFAVEGLSKERVDLAIGTIERVLDNDRKRCEGYENELAELDTESEIYKDLNEVKYRLHAVLVHDGAPSGGHYWTFIRDWRVTEGELTWLKCSDSLVTRVSESDMLRWSTGGLGHASAYCLIYTSNEVMDTGVVNSSVADESRRLLPPSRLDEIERSRMESTNDTTQDVIKETDMYAGVTLNQQTW